MNLFDAKFLFASLIWGSVGCAYATYGWKQRRPVPLIGGVVMMGTSYLIGSALLMSLVSIAIIAGVYWLVKRGY